MPFVEYSGEIISDNKKPSTFEKGKDGYSLATQDDLKQQVGNDWWHLPAAVIAGVGAWEASKAVRDWYKSKSEPEAVRKEPTFVLEPVPEQPANKLEQLQKRAEAGREAGLGQTPIQGAAAPQTAPAPVPSPVATQPALQAPVSVTEAVATGQSPAKAIQTDVAQLIDETPTGSIATESGIKKRAAKTQQTFKSEAVIPPGTTFRGDIGNLDRSLFNVLGPEHRRNAMELLNAGKPFGNVKDVNSAVKDITSKYWQAVQSQIPETILGRDERAAQGLKSEFGNYGSLGKAAKVAGIAGTLLSIADLAKAAQQSKEGKYAEAVKTVVPVVDPTGIGTAAVQPESTAQMLSSISPIMGILSQLIGTKSQSKAPKGAAVPR